MREGLIEEIRVSIERFTDVILVDRTGHETDTCQHVTPLGHIDATHQLCVERATRRRCSSRAHCEVPVELMFVELAFRETCEIDALSCERERFTSSVRVTTESAVCREVDPQR